MSIGSILVGIACVLVAGAYLARPFRRSEADLDQAIEAWVARVRGSREVEVQGSGKVEEAVNFCPQCGRRVSPDHRFCPACGTRLRGGAE